MTEHYTVTRYQRRDGAPTPALNKPDGYDTITWTSHAPCLEDLTEAVVECQEALPEAYNSVETRRRFRAFLQELWLQGLDEGQHADMLTIEAVGQPMWRYLVIRHADLPADELTTV
jgi:hypothetical protein